MINLPHLEISNHLEIPPDKAEEFVAEMVRAHFNEPAMSTVLSADLTAEIAQDGVVVVIIHEVRHMSVYNIAVDGTVKLVPHVPDAGAARH
jgi:hypothetical protein